jgi:hypothetical protein
MTETRSPFEHSTPELYARYMGPLLFEPYAKVVAQRAALLQPDRILETAAGTGIVTRALHGAVPQAHIVATDVNPGMLALAAQRLGPVTVSFQRADAKDLPFDDESFDLVVCQFGVMFFPDKVRAHEEARRPRRCYGGTRAVGRKRRATISARRDSDQMKAGTPSRAQCLEQGRAIWA